MDNLITGVIVFIICTLCTLFSWRLYKKSSYHSALLFLVLCGLILKLYGASDHYLHAWDERYHALVAKNLIKHPLKPTLYDDPLLAYDYKNWTANHVWLHKQPVPLWGIAISVWLFGANEITVRLPSIILTTIGIIIMFRIARILYNPGVAFIAAFLYSINGLIISLVGGRDATDHIDIFFLFFISLAVLLVLEYIRNENQLFNIFSGVAIGFAVLSKWLPALIVIPVAYLLMKDSGKFATKRILCNLAIITGVALLTFGPWQLYIHMNFPQEADYEGSFNIKHITEGLEKHGEPFWYHFKYLGKNYGEAIYIPAIWFIYKSVKKRNQSKRLALLVWFIIPYIFFSFAKTKMQAYTLFAAPSIFIITALYYWYLKRYRNRFRYKILPILVLIALILLPVRYTIEKAKINRIRDRNPGWVTQIKALKPLGKELDGKLVIFNTEWPIETMFYVDCSAYPCIPDQMVISELQEKGYTVLIR